MRRRAYKLLNIFPKLDKVKRKKEEKHLFRWRGIVDAREQWVEYEYEKLDLPNNFYFMTVARFTDRVKFSIAKANGYKYFPLPIGGFPQFGLVRDDFSSVDTVEIDEMILPSQGCIIQWCPDHKVVPVLEKRVIKAGHHTERLTPKRNSSVRARRSATSKAGTARA